MRPSLTGTLLAGVVAATLAALGSAGVAGAGGISDRDRLQARLQALAEAHPGRLGICAQDADSAPVCINGDQRFSLQSVMKLVVGAAMMRAADRGRIRLDDPVTIRREDLSVNIQPIADIVAARGSFETTIADLVRRAVVESDSAATDVLISRLGGIAALRTFLAEAGIAEIRIDRTERELQTETSGLQWRPEHTYPARLEADRSKVPAARKEAAFKAYLYDKRDTATPRAMAKFLTMLASGRLLEPASTRQFREIMAATVTFPDRIRAGTPEGWSVGHKTGTSQTVGGVNGVTNDVGILTAPDGGFLVIAAFLAESTAPAPGRAAVIAEAARAITASYR